MNHVIPIDISNNPDLLRLVREARANNKPTPLIEDDQTVALITPIETAETRKLSGVWTHYNSAHVQEALKKSAGTLRGVNREELLGDIANQRDQESSGRHA